MSGDLIEGGTEDRAQLAREWEPFDRRTARARAPVFYTGGVQIEGRENAWDHVALVTVSKQGADIANLRLDGILDKTGKIPGGGDTLCFEAARCVHSQ